VELVQSVSTAPVQIDTADPLALERALRRVNGKALINSVNGKRESMDAVFPLVKRYGGVVVALCLDENGIPSTSEGRLAIARKILAEGSKYGLGAKDFVFDALTLAVSADAEAAKTTLETVRRLNDELGVHTVLGVSNVSFGLPNRPALNNAMYTLAKRAGLSAAIANPAAIGESSDEAAFDVLLGRDVNCEKWISLCRQNENGAASGAAPDGDLMSRLAHSIKRGLKEDSREIAVQLTGQGVEAVAIVEKAIVPALEEIGIPNPMVEIGGGKLRHKYTPHTCRRTFATLLKRVAGADKDKQELIGHASPEMLRYYQDTPLDDLRAITDAL
jgi:5-methyltetrahydrofolate--homocysteine methyltransferase